MTCIDRDSIVINIINSGGLWLHYQNKGQRDAFLTPFEQDIFNTFNTYTLKCVKMFQICCLKCVLLAMAFRTRRQAWQYLFS